MPILTPNLSEMTDFQASRPNTYRARITEVEVVRSKKPNEKSGKFTNGIQPTFAFRAPRLTDGEERDVTRRAWLPTDGKGTFNFDQLLRCVGLVAEADAIKEGEGRVGFDTDLLINKEVTIVLSNQEMTEGAQKGKLADQIDSFLPAE